ncbi:MAG: DUF4433 domain-containing protein [Chloroflexi bacterium AL-W]|nr:DUF4433 domain-containing protein [Chloroflexi bacterium AL-N1]NOK71192.1 DUF4433 domain-containing protein [Chloroflexi bacterium AL-N10]NOK78658.1 DUF4433 domain-containing protein [Chloroflexi bacterium AL-N5]NOK85954.1 DUF4433 domain-containing protein [Chloroflexi bacterium AL-W]NOK92929.1 DUF4433 domain-containing protein [Chloroflexi bacterium AL-N15]
MKTWHKRIERHIEEWSVRLGNRKWWPKYIYHFTDVNNAVQIITTGYLYSHAECEKQGIMVVDNASPEIINQTRLDYLNYVRLYFRPRTPTQYRNEGIRPFSKRELDAHCPIPNFLLL